MAAVKAKTPSAALNTATPAALMTGPASKGNQLEEWKRSFDAAVLEHRRAMERAQAQFQSTLAQAESEMSSLIAAATAPTQAEPAQEQTNQQQQPACTTIHTEEGEPLLILNREASILMVAVIDRLAELLPEIQRAVGGGRRR